MPPADPHKSLLHGSLDVLVLAILADGPQYGYSLQKKVSEAGNHAIKAGTLYPLLHRMEADGLITPTWEKTTGRPRKWYALTPAGQKALTRQAADWQAALARMQAVVLPALRRVTRFPDAPALTPPEPA
ncbi:MAG: PadR family transcriptional regulator [Planctomycetota bacterium]